MDDRPAQHQAVAAKAVLIDPSAMTVLWMNESARHDFADASPDAVPGAPLAQAVPLAETLGLEDAVREVADSGSPRDLRAGLVSTVRGSVSIVASVYRLPAGEVLVVMENAWQPKHGKDEERAQRPARRRSR